MLGSQQSTFGTHHSLEFVGEYALNEGQCSFGEPCDEDCWFGVEMELHTVFVGLDIKIVGEFRLLVFNEVPEEAFWKFGELLDDEYWFRPADSCNEGGDGVGFLRNETQSN